MTNIQSVLRDSGGKVRKRRVWTRGVARILEREGLIRSACLILLSHCTLMVVGDTFVDRQECCKLN